MKGSLSHLSSGPVGTTSVWPAKHSRGAFVPRRAHRLSTSPQRIFSMAKPIFFNRSISMSWQPLSNGVSERQAISSWARASVSFRISYFPENPDERKIESVLMVRHYSARQTCVIPAEAGIQGVQKHPWLDW